MNLDAETFRKLGILRKKAQRKAGFRLSWDAFFSLTVCKGVK